MKEMLVAEYAKLRKITDRAVTKALNKGYATPGVVSSRKMGNTWILIVDEKKLKCQKKNT